jgi:hypothetical protein
MSFGTRASTGFRGVERRGEVRERTAVTAHIMLPAGQTLKCSVTNFSKTGARLAVASAFGVPDAFELRAGGQIYQVMVIRRGVGHVGITFA